MKPLLALTLDLDDTLWPIWPAIARAEAVLHAWLAERAPATAARHDVASLRLLRDEVARERPQWAHDLTAIRLESLRLALTQCGDDPALADDAFAVFFAERQRVDLFDDVLPALDRLASRYQLIALSNGNADLQQVGLARWFRAAVSARSFGVGKPDARIFLEACRQAGAAPGQVLHIGDDLALDVQGALAAGLQAAWVVRPQVHPTPGEAPPGTHHVVRDLAELADRIGV
ncbi:HAD family hydrolase [Schlegelella sp. S2-27]|uniref:HAD family hydrolase n=1 Tax=Caldimonas mangrovi TaxID=2944811 RepID=A0ABT0YM81_9BURK|nr:HAD family hydrolase [Caldimonas mangrovi]MCM5679841.1 HAD family hydrolase [Caldimonas mangrovi]